MLCCEGKRKTVHFLQYLVCGKKHNFSIQFTFSYVITNIGTTTIFKQPNPIYEVPVPISTIQKQRRSGMSENDSALRYSNRMNLNTSYNTQSQIKEEVDYLQMAHVEGKKGVDVGGRKTTDNDESGGEYEDYI